MKKLMNWLLVSLLRSIFWFRYRVEVRGLENLETMRLKRPGGVLILPNHPAVLVDPCLVALNVLKKRAVRPIIVEYMYQLPLVRTIMNLVNALPVPDFESSANSFKRKRGEHAIAEIVAGLKRGESFLIYPAGRLKRSAIEEIGGASATHQIVQQIPDVNIVLVRTKGLWGSIFSSAYTGKTPPLFPTLIQGIKVVFKNLIFFTPRRKVIVEFHSAPDSFPYRGTRLEINRWLEKWYNTPDGLSSQQGEYPGDSLMRVSYSFWKNDLKELYKPKEEKKDEIFIQDIDSSIQQRVFAKLQELSSVNHEELNSKMTLSSDLGLDSLDIAELAAFLQEQFHTTSIPVTELTTVGKVLGFASKKIKVEKERVEEKKNLAGWQVKGPRVKLQIAPGNTIPEVFLNNCSRMGSAPACADDRSGIVSYSKLKLGVLLFAEKLKAIPEKYIGVLLPASVAAYLVVLACQLAGKVPVMINWTVGSRHLQAVRELSGLKTVLTSWAFLERLDADLTGIDDCLVMLEEMRREFTLADKLRAFWRSKKGTSGILRTFGADKITEKDEAVLLFTSGTENMPKGVPLSHENILANTKSVFDGVDIYSDDIMLGILPPFHAFGFGTSGIMELLSGVRAVYYPNPTDGQGVADAFAAWGATITCGAPSFIKAFLKMANKEQIQTMRLCVSGAEKAPLELFELLAKFGKESCLIEGYGVTECSPILTANRPGKPRKGVGPAMPGVEICIVHPETHKFLASNEEGLVLARGANIFKGYLNPGIEAPFLNIEGKFWYNTGDIGSLDTEGRLTLCGRKKRFIKIGGEMVSLQAIENAFLESAPKMGWKLHEEGPSIAVLGKEVSGEKAKMVLVSVFATNVEAVNEALREQGFSSLIRISNVIQMIDIPLMGTGKINYRVLEENYLN